MAVTFMMLPIWALGESVESHECARRRAQHQEESEGSQTSPDSPWLRSGRQRAIAAAALSTRSRG